LNGFVLKYHLPKMHLEWSRKVSSAPVLLARGEMGIYSLSHGKIALLSSKRSEKEVSLDLGGVAHFKSKNGMFAVASDSGKVQVFSEKEDFRQLSTFSVRTPLVSIELLENEGKTYALASGGGGDQTFSLYEISSGTHIWTFNGNGGSPYMQPVLHGSHIWLEQDGYIAAIDIATGKIAKKHSILGNGASLYIHGNTLYCATPQKLLYAFPL
jgi:outer membrane protein assembly factor BamB